MGKLNPIQNTAPSPTPAPAGGRLASKGTPQSLGKQSLIAQGDNLKNTFIDIPISEYKEYTPFDTGDVYINSAMNDTRAVNQGSGEKWLHGMGRLLGTTGTKVMADVGYLGGSVGWALTGDITQMTDNGFSAYFNGLEQDIKDGAPIYKPSWVENGGFWDKVGSLSFWMDEGVDGAAFMASAMIPGLAITKGLKLGMGIAKIINKGAKVAKGINIGATTLVNTIGEAAVEAKGNQDQIRSQLQSKVDQGLMTSEEAERKAADGARNTFFMNAAVLTIPNMIQSGWMFGKTGIGLVEKGILSKITNPVTGEAIKDVNAVTKRMIAKDIAKKFGTNIISEGLWEENVQLAIEHYNTDVATGKEDRGMLSGIVGNMAENFSTTEGRISMFLGAVLGQPVAVGTGFVNARREKKQIEASHAMFGTNYQAYTDTLKNDMSKVFKKQLNTVTGKEELVLDENGKPVVDDIYLMNVKAGLINLSNLEKQKANALLQGDKEGFDLLSNYTFANWVIPMLETGEGSLDAVNKQIDLVVAEHEKQIQGENESLSSEEKFDIDKYKNRQKQIAKEMYDVIQKETDFSGIWDAPSTAKTKEELDSFNNSVTATIREKAFQQATNSWLGIKRDEVKEINNKIASELILDKTKRNNLSAKLNTLKGKKDVVDGTEAGEDSESKFIRENFSKDILDSQIKNMESEIKEIDDRIKENDTNYKKNSKKLESYIKTIESNKDVKQGGLATLTNNSLREEVVKNWEKSKTEAKQIKEQAAKEEATKKTVQEEEKKKPGGTEQVKKTIQDIDDEIAYVEEQLKALVETDLGQEYYTPLQDDLRNLRAERESLNNGTKTPSQVINKKVSGSDTSLGIPETQPITQDVVSQAMSDNMELDPTHQGFDKNVIDASLGNNVETDESTDRNASNIGAASNVVMHKEFESNSVRLPNGQKLFYFTTDEEGRPIRNNTSGVDFEFVNNPLNLQKDSEVEFRIITDLSQERKDSINKSIQKSITELKEAKKSGIAVDESNNFGFGKAEMIGIYSGEKLIGFVQLPHSFNTSEDKLTKNGLIVRENILNERKAILEKLNKGEKVTTKIATKGKGNYVSNNNLNKPEALEEDKFDGVTLYAYYDGNLQQWIIPDTPKSKSNKKIKKQLTDIQNSVQKGKGVNGQVAMLVRTANGSYEKIPVYSNNLTEDQINNIVNILTTNPNFTAKEYIQALNPIVFASLGDKANFRIFGSEEAIKIEIDGRVINLNDLGKQLDAFKTALADLKQNITGGVEGIKQINSVETQKRFTDNNTLSTNAVLVDGKYFHQPYIQFESILPKEAKVVEPKVNTISTDQKEANQTGLNNFLTNAPLQSEVQVSGDHYIITKPDGTKIKLARVTSATNPQGVPDNKFVRAGAAIGTAFDTFGREFLSGELFDEKGEVKESSKGYQAILSVTDTNNKKKVESIIKALLTHMNQFKESFPKGTKFHTEERVLYQETNTIEGFDGIAGTMDILVEQPSGEISLYDLKALSKSSLAGFYAPKDNESISGNERYSRQLNSYAILLYNQYGITLSNINLSIMEASHNSKEANYEQAPLNYITSKGSRKLTMTPEVKVNGKVVLSYKTNVSNQPSQVKPNPTTIEDKKADIERRRQEERSKSLEEIGVDKLGFDGKIREEHTEAVTYDLNQAIKIIDNQITANPNSKLGSLGMNLSNAVQAELNKEGIKVTDKTPLRDVIDKLKEINAKYDAELAALETQPTIVPNNPAVQAAINDDTQTGVDLSGLTGVNTNTTQVNSNIEETVTLNNKEYTIQTDGKVLNSKGKEVKDPNEINRIHYEVQVKKGLAFTYEFNKKQKVKVLLPITNSVIEGKPSIKLVTLQGEEREDILELAQKSPAFNKLVEELYKKIC